MTIVSDTSSISNLIQIELLHVLHALYEEIIITPAVKRELYYIPEQAAIVEELEWIKVEAPKDQKMVVKLMTELDLGESESIALAIETNADYLIIDEFHGRIIADSYNIKIVGILGILINARKSGLIKEVKPYIEDLVAIGFRLNSKLINKVLSALGEL